MNIVILLTKMGAKQTIAEKEQILRFEIWAQIYRMLARDQNLYDHHLLREIAAYERNTTNKEIIATYDLTRWSRLREDDIHEVARLNLHKGLEMLLERFPHYAKHYLSLAYACYLSDITTVKLLIKYGASKWNYGLWAANKTGRVEMAQLMIECGANNWRLAFDTADENKIMQLVLDRIAGSS